MNKPFYKNIIFTLLGVFLLTFQYSAYALDWRLKPRLSIDEIYSDNVNLSHSDKKSALVTEINPGITLTGTSSVSRFDLNYTLQSLYNAGGDGGLDINHQLQMDTNYEFVTDRLFMDSSSSISQQNISNRQISNDNISGDDTSTTVSTFQLSPYWTPHFKNFADGLFRVTYNRVSTDGGNNALSDTNSYSQNFSLNSGSDFSYISWSLLFNNSTQSNGDGEDVDFQDSEALIRYALGRELSLFARAGHSNNSFASNSDSNKNGVTYTFGGQWKPSHRFRLEAGYGNNSFITVEISPFSRLNWITTYSNNDIGLNTGDTWNTSLNYRTKRSTWNLNYNEETITTQSLLLNRETFIRTINVTNPNNNQNTPIDLQFERSLPTLTDEVFITKRLDLSVSFNTGKSTLSGNAFRTIRNFELSGEKETVTGVSGNWNWNYSRRTSTILRSSWQKTESDGVDSFSDNRFDISFRVTRNILSRLNGNIQYQYTNQTSDDNSNSYSENRITAGLSLRF